MNISHEILSVWRNCKNTGCAQEKFNRTRYISGHFNMLLITKLSQNLSILGIIEGHKKNLEGIAPSPAPIVPTAMSVICQSTNFTIFGQLEIDLCFCQKLVFRDCFLFVILSDMCFLFLHSICFSLFSQQWGLP